MEIFADKIARMIIAGLTGTIVVEVYASIMQWKFQDTDNAVGKGFAIAGIYLFSVVYCKHLRGSVKFPC
jgi:hypothetical protein